MKVRSSKQSRIWHKWTGLVSSIFVFILCVSGIPLMHYEEWNLADVRVSSRYLPKKYFQVKGQNPTIQALAVSPSNPSLLFAGANHGLFKSMDGGQTWEPKNEGLFNLDVHSITLDPARAGVVYLGTGKGIFKSENDGENWTQWFEESTGLPGGRVNHILLDPRDPDTLYASTSDGFYLSDDSGEFWVQKSAGDLPGNGLDVRAARFLFPDKNDLFIGTDAGAFRREDGGDSWERKWTEGPERILDFISTGADSEFFYVGTENGFYKSFNKGVHWIQDKTFEDLAVSQVYLDPLNPSALYLVAGGGIYFSADGGDRWQTSFPDRDTIKGDFTPSPDLTATKFLITAGPKPVWFLGSTGGLLLSYDQGATWIPKRLEVAGNKNGEPEKTMDMVKLFTEIHTGRIFGSYAYLLVDVATLGLIFLIFTGIKISFHRRQAAQKIQKKLLEAQDEEDAVDALINVQETAYDLSRESSQIHDMIEQIEDHLGKCKNVYMKKEKKEIEEVDRHVHILDAKIQGLMSRLKELGE